MISAPVVTAAPLPAAGTAPARWLFVDHLRSIAVLLLVVFHTARLFDAEPWHIKHVVHEPLADLVVRLLNQLQMPLLFLLAGVSMALALRARPAAAFVRERVQRLLVPLLAGIVLFVLPQVWVERRAHGAPGRASPIDFDGSFAAFVPRFFDCCYPQAQFSWHHLWFLAYLFVYALVLLPLLAVLERRPLAAIVRRSAERAGLAGMLALGLVPVALEAALRPRYPSNHALAGDWANHAHYAFLVLVGWWLVRAQPALAAMHRHATVLAAAALLASAAWLAAPLWAPMLPAAVQRAAHVLVYVGGEWVWLLALLGLGQRLLDRRFGGPLGLTAFNRRAMPFYLVHQTVIILLGGWWLQWQRWPLAKAVAVALVCASVSLAACLVFERWRLTRWLVGLKLPPPSAPAAPRGSAG